MDTLRFRIFLVFLSLCLAADQYSSISFLSYQYIKSFAFSRDRQYMVLTPFDYNNNNYPPLLLFRNNGSSYQQLGKIACNCNRNGNVGSVQLNNDGSLIVVAYTDGYVRLYKINQQGFPSLKQQFSVANNYFPFKLSVDDQYLMLHDPYNSNVYRYNSVSQLYQSFFYIGRPDSVVMSEDGRHIFAVYQSSYILYTMANINYTQTQLNYPNIGEFSFQAGFMSQPSGETYHLILLLGNKRFGGYFIKFYRVTNSIVAEAQAFGSFQVAPAIDISSNGKYLALSFSSRKQILLYTYNEDQNIYELTKQFWDLPVGNAAGNGSYFVNVDSEGSVASGVLYYEAFPLTRERVSIIFFQKCNIQLCESCWLGECIKCEQGQSLSIITGRCGSSSIGRSLQMVDKDLFLVLMLLSIVVFLVAVSYVYCRYLVRRFFGLFSKQKVEEAPSSQFKQKRYDQFHQEKEIQSQVHTDEALAKKSKEKTKKRRFGRQQLQQADQTKTSQLSN